jgi:hypothetical protein
LGFVEKSHLSHFTEILGTLRLVKELGVSEKKNSAEQDIVQLAAKNPHWITLVTQTMVVMCLVLLASKIV